MDHAGLLSWANSIRLTMASDPGRQVFKDQVQTHGFMFLEDYLDNIVSGAKADPLIELVKTPGRKKAIARKPKLMSSQLVNNVISEDHSVNENTAPINSFQAALQKVQIQKGTLEGLKNQEGQNGLENSLIEGSQRLPFSPIQPAKNIPSVSSDLPVVLVPPAVIQPTLDQIPHANVEHNDLSVIAEDEEEPSERSRGSASGPIEIIGNSPIQIHEDSKDPAPSSTLSVPEHVPSTSQPISNVSSASSTETFHSISLGSPLQHKESSEPSQTALDTNETTTELMNQSPKLLPTKPSTDIPDSLMNDVQDDTICADRKSSERPVAPSFPALPGPMPIRKSMRPPRDPSLNAVMLGAATPGAPVGGKRTSWLAKAREVKALEAPAKKPNIPTFSPNPSSGSSLPQGTKRKSEDMLSMPPIVSESDERQAKAPKLVEGESVSNKSKDIHSEKSQGQQPPADNSTPIQGSSQHDDDMQPEGVLDRLKKTVEGLGVRVTKTMSKSVGGGAATALAEARAAAEARVAERDRKEDEMTMAMGLVPANVDLPMAAQDTEVKMSAVRQNESRLSISELFPAEGRVKAKHKVSEKPFQFTPSFVPTSTKKNKEATMARERTSTTPHSPQPKSRPLPPSPVFNKPPPVFVPPTNTTSSVFTHQPVFNPPSPPKYTMPPSIALGFSPRVPTPSSKGQTAMPLTTHSTLESVQSSVFDRDDVPAWAPSTQDTEYTTGYESQSQPRSAQICDEDDSWPVDEKLAAGVQWTFGASKEDSMTWSTLPSQSTRADTGPITRVSPIQEDANNSEACQQIPGAFDMETDKRQTHDELFEHRDTELEDMILGSSKSTIAVVEPKIPRSQSQMSMASSESSQSQIGFLGQASKLFGALGTSKKKQPEVKKVLQMAATAAKKQQEEADKKAARLKEMDNRRQLALQRKAEEEKAKALEEERKMKEEAERRKKEREDLTDKRSLKPSTSKREEESNKKRKIETEKKQELKKPGPSVLVGKSHLKTALKQPSTTNLNSSFGFGLAQAFPSGPDVSSSLKGKGIAQQPLLDDDVSQPSQLVQSQMAARAKAQIDAAKQVEPLVASESIELPDINSEYSDSEDEDRPRTFDPPDWAQSPELRQALEIQSTINPDDIFGAVRPIKMEEIFKTRTSRFRPRSSSANWTGTDRLTVQEEKDYARRMGFK